MQRSPEACRHPVNATVMFLGQWKTVFSSFPKASFLEAVMSYQLRENRAVEKCPFLSFLIYLCVSVERQIGFLYLRKGDCGKSSLYFIAFF